MAKKIALDAGHGLSTAGKQTPDGIKEWSLNDKVRDKVVNILKGYDVEIIHTDKDEGKTDDSLTTRRNMYVNTKVDAFVSIHHNAYTGDWNNATGVEVFTDRNSTAKDKELAKLIYNRMVEYTGLKGRGIKEYNFAVINQDSIPAVLCEGGFMDGTKDYKYITSDEGQTAYAKAVAEGLIEFLDLKKKKTTTTKKPTTPEPEPAAKKENSSFLVKVTANSLRIRKGPGTNYATVAYINDKGTYTIVETKEGWGKLKSGAGWISLDYTKRV